VPPSAWSAAYKAGLPGDTKTFSLRFLLLPCRTCPWGTLTAGSTPCVHNVSDTVCPACPTCPAGQYEAVPCAPDAGVGGAPTCAACTSSCAAGQFLGVPCSRYADAACLPCSPSACPAGTYAPASSCVGGNNTQCLSCVGQCGCSAAGTASCAAGTGPTSTGAGCVCTCKAGYTGVACDRCADTSLAGDRCDAPCNCLAAGTVGGVCGAHGSCTCRDGFVGRYCDRCVAGRYGSGCDGVCACVNGRGICADGRSGDGRCYCAAGWRGSDCGTADVTPSPASTAAAAAAVVATALAPGTPVARQTATQGTLFRLPLPASAFTMLPGGANVGGWTAALASGPGWLTVAYDGASPSNYSLTGTPARGDVTRGSRWLASVSSTAVVRGTLTGSSPAVTAQVSVEVDVDAVNTAPTLTVVPLSPAVTTAAVGAVWQLTVAYGAAGGPATTTVGYADADVSGGFNDTVVVSTTGAPAWLTLTAASADLAADALSGPFGVSSDVASMPTYTLRGTVPTAAADTDVAFTLAATDRAGAAATRTVSFHVNGTSYSVLAYALGGGTDVVTVTQADVGAFGTTAAGRWSWPMPDTAFRRAPATGTGPLAAPPLASYAATVLRSGGGADACAWLNVTAVAYRPSAAQVAAQPSGFVLAAIPRPVLYGSPPYVDPTLAASMDCNVTLSATNAAGYTATGALTVRVPSSPLGVTARPAAMLAPVIRAVNEVYASDFDLSALFRYNETAGLSVALTDAVTGRAPIVSLLAVACGSNTTRGAATTATAFTVTGVAAAACTLTSGAPLTGGVPANDTLAPPGSYAVNVTVTPRDGAVAPSRLRAAVTVNVRVLPATVFRARASEWR
jgi:hypothetical protein